MLLNYRKPVTVSSTLGSGTPAGNAVDENIKTWWSAATASAGEWIATDLGDVATVRAVQLNFADVDVDRMGKCEGQSHKYRLWYSVDGRRWRMLVDKSRNDRDVPHDYVELATPVEARYLKLENVAMPTGKFALSGFRVFGNGHGEKPAEVRNFVALRGGGERRNAWLRWQRADDAYAYNIYIGTSPDKLYNSVMVYDANEYYYKGMDAGKPYYFAIEAVNENGVSKRTTTQAE